MKRIVAISILFAFVFLFAGCGKQNNVNIEKNSIYNILNYEDDEIYNIENISLDNNLSEKCVTYKFTYLSDNYEIKAYISIPLTFAESEKPCKCIIYNRGGNSKIGLLSDTYTAQICSQTNRVVIASQYRGVDGGTGNDEFGGKDLNDVIKLIDFCENKFAFIDMTDLCVAGESRGGMMSYMAARQDNRIKKIIAISAVTDLFQSYKERENMKKVLFNYIGGSPDDIPYEYEKRSAVYWADEIKVPVLIIHSKEDKSVAYSQAEKMYSELSKCNSNCKIVTRDNDIHGLEITDANYILDWLKL